MAEILSQSERDSLLTTFDRAGAAGVSFGQRAGTRGAEGSPTMRPELLHSLRQLHEGFAGELAASLSGQLRLPVDVTLISVDQTSYGEFTVSLENPTCLNLVQVDPLEGAWLVELSCSIAFPIVDRLLGGGAELAPVPQRPFTEIEWRLLSRVTDRIAATLRSAWSEIGDLNLKVTRVGSHPQAVPFVARDAAVVIVSFDVSMGDASGVMNVCLPIRTLVSFEDRLKGVARPTEGEQAERASEKAAAGHSGAPRAGIELIVELASTRLTLDEVTNLAVGDVIVTNCNHGQPLTVSIDGDSRFAGFAGLVKGRKAVRIDSALVPVNEPHRLPVPAVSSGMPPAGEKGEFASGD
jgi:flagellar motor switch protein FliM